MSFLSGALGAFAVIEGPDGSERTITIGRTVADDDGAYRLLLPARL